MRLVAAVIALLGACTAGTGTLTIELATAPGSTLLQGVDRIALTLTNPPGTFEAQRTDEGLDLSLEIEAVESDGLIYIELFDANGGSIAAGQAPPFPLRGADGKVVIYVAPPYSILGAPKELEPRAKIGATDVIYGAVIAGGLDESGLPSASMAIYNIYDHTIQYLEPMPVHRAGVALGANDTLGVYVFGGIDDTAAPTSTLHRFQTNVAPKGTYVDLGVHPGLESTGARAIKLGPDTFFLTGQAPALISASTITQVTTLSNVPPTATAATASDGSLVAAIVREGYVDVFHREGTGDTIGLPTSESGQTIAARPEAGTAVVVGGDTLDAYVVTFASQVVAAHPDTLSTVRHLPAIAATKRHIVVAGGLDGSGAPIASADILDATTLERLATVPCAPRTNARALSMTNDQIMILGGDETTSLIELFTPPVPTDPAPP